MASEVSICNRALQLVSQAPILSLEDASAAAADCLTLYSQERDILLQKHPWSFATERQSLALLPTKPAFGFAYEFSVPLNWVKVLGCYNDHGERLPADSFQVEGGKVLAHYNAIYAKGVRTDGDINLLPELFKECLAHRIAAGLAISLLQNVELSSYLMKQAVAKLAEARGEDSRENIPAEYSEDTWLISRG